MSETAPPPSKLRRTIPIVAAMAAWNGALFLGAGTLDWPRGWISVAAYGLSMAIAGVVVSRANPELMVERAKWRRKDTKGFDKIFLAIVLPLVAIHPVIAGMDAVRFEWWPISAVWIVPALLLFALGMGLATWVLAVNRHAENTVRIQTDRGHQVVTTGPYRFVRHPMYVGAIVMYVAFPLLWGSGAATVVSLALIALFVWRTAMEDKTLHRELPGYAEYALRTRYRLVPGLW